MIYRAVFVLLVFAGIVAAQLRQYSLTFTKVQRTTFFAPATHCQPSGPTCPDPWGRSRDSRTAARENGRRAMMVSHLVDSLRAKSASDLVLEYVRPEGSPALTDLIVGIFDGDNEVARFSCNCRDRLSTIKEGEAIRVPLKQASKELGRKLLTHRIMLAAVFAPGGKVPESGETVVLKAGR
jgi:hypothetical protein